MEFEDLSGQIMGFAIEVHKILDPGLSEFTYEGCLAYELPKKKISCERQKEIPVLYEELNPECGY
ncbi:MAG: GxxExxY protein [Caldithrix sp.]|nr:GxxExxY protein [Caldithrix sp.]